MFILRLVKRQYFKTNSDKNRPSFDAWRKVQQLILKNVILIILVVNRYLFYFKIVRRYWALFSHQGDKR
jgi:hypothetical protein